MSGLKTKPGQESVTELIQNIEPAEKRQDCEELQKLFAEITGDDPVIWGGQMIGYGSYAYKTKSGQEGEWLKTGFAPRKTNISLYLMFRAKGHEADLEKLGKYKSGVGCLYIKRLADVDQQILRKLIKECYEMADEAAASTQKS